MDEPDKGQRALTQSDIDQRRVTLFLQPHFRAAATHAGLFRTCRLPPCKRAKRCCGCYPLEEIGNTHFKQFPPCVHDNQSQSTMLRAGDELCEREYQARLASGMTPEDIKFEEEAFETEFLENDGRLPDLFEPPVPTKRRRR